MTTTTTMTPLTLLHLLHIASPALPIGAFAYSQGLEPAVTSRLVHDEASAADWILGILRHNLTTLEIPTLARLAAAWSSDDSAAVASWSAFVRAARPTAELQAEDRRTGAALARVLETLEIPGAGALAVDPTVTYVTAFAFAVSRRGIPIESAATAIVFSWCENQVAAAMRLIPLGQSSGQRILARALAEIPDLVSRGLGLTDDEIGWSAPGLAMASAEHETQYSRIFRS